jgi:hypothetical protein
METPKEYYYTYYSYEEWGRGYFGSRGCKCLPEEDAKYFGSFKDKTFRPTQKIILRSDYATRTEAYSDEIILQKYYKVVENPHFANKAYQTSTKFYCRLSKEQRIKNGKKSGKIGGLKNKENKTGFCGMSAEKRSELGKRNSKKNKENMCGIFKMTSKELSDCGSKGGKKTFELKKGAFGISKEERSKIARSVCEKYSKLNGKKTYELGLGIFSLSKEEKIEISRKAGKIGSKNTNSQKWKCLVTGHISNPGGLSRYQKYRNIDVSQRVRLDEPDLDYNSKCDKIL